MVERLAKESARNLAHTVTVFVEDEPDDNGNPSQRDD
jgi:hypothetical protein